MPTFSRNPKTSLRSLVRVLWASTPDAVLGSSDACPVDSTRELVLPTGNAHVVFRLDVPLKTYGSVDSDEICVVGNDLLGGPRSEPYLRCTSLPVNSVGAELWPGVLTLLVGDRADFLAQRHTLLSDIWGRQADLAWEELQQIHDPESRILRLESLLEERFNRRRELHPAVRQALFEFQTSNDVRAVARTTGYSERRLSSLFREAVGLTPKVYTRLQRFQVALGALHEGTAPIGQIAHDLGYADQAHLTREFRQFSALTPAIYRKLAPVQARHVPLGR